MHDDDDFDPPAWQDSDPVDEALSPLLAKHRDQCFQDFADALSRNRDRVNAMLTQLGDNLIAKTHAILAEQLAEHRRLFVSYDSHVDQLQRAVKALSDIVTMQQRCIEALERR